ncbi:regulator [Streptomyces sp. SP17KL33]|uniref:regulator n=1 Tax=Streptomyces sp. SP17KL33 TaxID=3002534 RepID=UPI002E77016F|nr:regulator [Streptomyces sp. SP17KL33]MEE1838028.1 regulator [Streptomyces sp. SP17KL33]
MMPAFSPRQVQAASAELSSSGLIRLVSEIDDHGAIPPRTLSYTFADLTREQIRQAIGQADRLGLLDRSHAGLRLTPAGGDLADLYDASARWARRHNSPAPVCDFAERIRHTFALLGETSADPGLTAGETDAEFGRVQRLLAEWICTHQPRQICGDLGMAA